MAPKSPPRDRQRSPSLKQSEIRRTAESFDERRYRSLFDHAADAILINLGGRMVLANEAACHLFGAAGEEELLGKTPFDLFDPEFHDQIRERIGRLTELGEPVGTIEERIVRLDGRRVEVEVKAAPFPFGRERAIHVILRDITGRKRAEAVVEGQRRLLEMIARGEPLDATLGSLVLFIESLSPETRGSVLLLDRDGLRVHTAAAPSLPSSFWSAFEGQPIGPAAGSCGTAAFRRAQVVVEDIESDPLWADYRHLALPHGLRACWSTPFFDPEGGVAGTFAMYFDRPARPSAADERLIEIATQVAAVAVMRARAEEERRRLLSEAEAARAEAVAARDHLENILGRVNDGFVALDQEWHYTFVNQVAAELLGRSRPEDLIGRHIWTEYPDGVGQPFQHAYLRAAETLETVRFEDHYEPWDRWFENRIYPARDGVTIYFTEITERKRAERAIAEAAERLRLAVAAANVGLWDWDLAGNEVYFSPEWKRQIGYEDHEIRNEFAEWETRVHPDDLAPTLAQVRAYIAAPWPEYQTEFRFRHKDGTYRWIVARAALLRDASGRPVRMIGAHLDLTERRNAEEEVRRLNAALEQRVAERTEELEERNRELETFTYSVSHDLKAPLRGLDGYSRLLLADHARSLDEEGRFFVETIRQAALQMNQLIDDLLAYSRLERRRFHQEMVDAAKLVASLLAEREGELIERGVILETEIPPIAVRADREGLALAMRNLIDNALKFTARAERPAIEIRGVPAGEFLRLTVRDNGVGFDPKFQDDIFEIFHRLHRTEDYPGTGIGLAIVRRAMERMGGRAWGESEPGHGAAFHLEVPR